MRKFVSEKVRVINMAILTEPGACLTGIIGGFDEEKRLLMCRSADLQYMYCEE